MFFPNISFFLFFFFFPNEHVLMISTVAESIKAEPQQCPPLCLRAEGIWIYRLLWTYQAITACNSPFNFSQGDFFQYVLLEFPQGHRYQVLSCQCSSGISVLPRVLFKKVVLLGTIVLKHFCLKASSQFYELWLFLFQCIIPL